MLPEYYKTHIGDLDREHEDILGGLAELGRLIADKDVPRAATAVGRVRQLCTRHFQKEEGLLVMAGYPKLAEHADGHRVILSGLQRLESSLVTDLGESARMTAEIQAAVILGLLRDDKDAFQYLDYWKAQVGAAADNREHRELWCPSCSSLRQHTLRRDGSDVLGWCHSCCRVHIVAAGPADD